MQAITETPNELTTGLDSVSPLEMIRLFRQTDGQIFSGYRHHSGLNDNDSIQTLTNMIESIRDLIHQSCRSDGKKTVDIVVAGAGTSGRLAFFLANSARRWSTPHLTNNVNYHYLIAGGDRALTVGIEGAEDDLVRAVTDIDAILARPNSTVVYIGVTCGLSAPYVAGQIDRLLSCDSSSQRHIISLMGFNPIELARVNPIEKWDKSFADVARALEQSARTAPTKRFIINPVVGPEPLTGSTRMKSGSATKILLELILSISMSSNPDIDVYATIINRLNEYEQVCRATYRHEDTIAPLVAAAGHSLLSGGHVYYLGQDSLGVVGFVDASETVPTFGAGAFDVRGFILDSADGKSGWMAMQNADGDHSHISEEYCISQAHFQDKIIPTLTSRDTVILIAPPVAVGGIDLIALAPIVTAIIKRDQTYDNIPSIHLIMFPATNPPFTQLVLGNKTTNINIQLPFKEIDGVPSYIEMSLKWILNAVTTGGFVLAGKVFGNRMIDLGLTNNKLYYRSCGIVAKLFGVDDNTARQCLLRSVYSLDKDTPVPADIDTAPVYKHIEHAERNNITHIIPVALLLASGHFQSPSAARELLRQTPSIRKILNDAMAKSS
ncbi:hypothetical protein SAMD00019534_043890 [Acytostelium subglobosum LB1]|uniref:hypothetical protein n=1 Tax=Acytostelium subglobosum LB1 TaxID=1410327 RepID=UPI000644B1F2|nr:hypothetical protein SAMD00019534_121540 [Acytostelium subglobosum LB1]XP_012755333.1 hypothetical protein SAMD00019534_043890 [Acytostelium subglobosum LB1]GAM21214.1 hypothetical protein SAMD00019534_043890 [Acytostelium subglobosum LB1]GAM28978.1 hypothetical protein SAMD00019534_121540 [Acytostelium subglobosum LB1]|eukprot:XP_012748163.1 hypothetical protein SAMD00019534_121540 [Acytostelium subglobosum LB1]